MYSPVQLSKRYLANRFVVLFSALLLAVLLAACQSISIDQGATPQAAKTQMEEETMESSTLIPRELLFGNPDKTNVKLSPDGAMLSYLAPVEGVLNVWVGPANEPGSARPVTNDTGRGIRMYGWTYTNDHLLYLQDKNGDENWRLYGVNLKTDEIKDLTPLDGVQARIQAVSPRFPNEIMVALNDRVPQLHDLHMINLDSGDRRLVLENEGFAGFLVDDDYQARFGQRFTPDGGIELLKYAGPGAWEPFLKIGMEDALTTQPFGFDKSGQTLYMIDSRQRNTAALVTLDLATGEQQVLYEDPRADLSWWA